MADINSVPRLIKDEIKEEEVCSRSTPDMLVIEDEVKYAEIIKESLVDKNIPSGDNSQGNLLITTNSNENANRNDYDVDMKLTIKIEEGNFVPNVNYFFASSIERLQGNITPPLTVTTRLHNESDLYLVRPQDKSVGIHSVDVDLNIDKPDAEIIHENGILSGEDSKEILRNSSNELYSRSDGTDLELFFLDNRCGVDQEFSLDSPLLEDATLSCSLCSFTTERKETMRNHERNHQKADVLKCMYCDQKYTRKILYLHIQTVHPGQKNPFASNYEESKSVNVHKFKCTKCDYSTPRKLLLKRHTRKHLTENLKQQQKTHRKLKRLRCTGCGCTFSSSYLRSHQYKCKAYLLKQPISKKKKTVAKFGSTLKEQKRLNDNNEKSSNFSCPECSYIPKYALSLERHLKSHGKYEVSSCVGCGFKFTPKSLMYHQYKCKEFLLRKVKLLKEISCENTTTAASRNRSSTSCPECSYRPRVPSNLIPHLKSHKIFQNLLCGGCDFMSTPTTLRHHRYRCEAYLLKRIKDLSENHTENVFENPRAKVTKPKPKNRSNVCCSECSFVTSSKLELKQHQKTHNVFCAGCGFESTRFRLRYHQYKCEAYYLLQHSEDLHKNPFTNATKKYNCPECSYTATKPSLLKRHQQKSHSHFLVLSCSGCGFTTSVTNLNYHQSTCKAYLLKQSKDLNENPAVNSSNFSCSECTFVTKRASGLTRHQQSHRRYEVLSCAGCGFMSSRSTLVSHQNRCYAYFSKKTEDRNENLSENVCKAESESPSTFNYCSETFVSQETQDI